MNLQVNEPKRFKRILPASAYFDHLETNLKQRNQLERPEQEI